MSFNIDLSKVLTTDKEVLERVSEIDIFSYYLRSDIDIKKLYKCPVHEDNTPSLGFYNGSTGIHYKCFGCGSRGNAFGLVMAMYNISYGKAVQMVIDDLCLSKNNTFISPIQNRERKIKRYTDIIVKERVFNLADIRYWNPYSIELEDLRHFDVKACERIYIHNEYGYRLWGEHTNANPIYSFLINDRYKIYRPLTNNKSNKWLSNCSNQELQGYNQLPESGDILFITSSLKDVMVFYKLGYSAIAPHSEGNNIPEYFLEDFKKRFKQIYIFYDNDKAGIDYGKKASEKYGMPYVYIPIRYCEDGIKDISDFIKNFGREDTYKLIKNLINE